MQMVGIPVNDSNTAVRMPCVNCSASIPITGLIVQSKFLLENCLSISGVVHTVYSNAAIMAVEYVWLENGSVITRIGVIIVLPL